MSHLIDNGEEWMEPMLEFRDMLYETIDKSNEDYDPFKYRMNTRRNGQEGIGPYKPIWRKKLLETLLRAQKELDSETEEVQLITNQELVAIQVTWQRDGIFNFNVPEIYESVFGRRFAFESQIEESVKIEREILMEACNSNEQDFELINELLKLQQARTLLMNKWGTHKDLENKINEVVMKSNA